MNFMAFLRKLQSFLFYCCFFLQKRKSPPDLSFRPKGEIARETPHQKVANLCRSPSVISPFGRNDKASAILHVNDKLCHPDYLFSGANPAIRFNLLWRTPPQKDFHFYRGYDNHFHKSIIVLFVISLCGICFQRIKIRCYKIIRSSGTLVKEPWARNIL